MGMGMMLQSLSISQFEEFTDFLFNGNVKRLNEAGIIRYPEKIDSRYEEETIKTASLDDYVRLSDGLVYFTYVKAIAKGDIVLNNKYSEIDTIYKGEEILVTNIDIDISLAWWFKFDKIVIEGIVKRTTVSSDYTAPTIKDQSWMPMFEERPFEFMANLPSNVSINEFMEVL